MVVARNSEPSWRMLSDPIFQLTSNMKKDENDNLEEIMKEHDQ